MPGAGALDRRITLERKTTTASDSGAPVETWDELAERAASRKDVSDGERFKAGGLDGYRVSRFTIRWDPELVTLTSADRLIHDDETYEIHGVKEVRGRHQRIEITAAVQRS